MIGVVTNITTSLIIANLDIFKDCVDASIV